MSTKAKIICILSIVAILAVAAALYFIPKSTPVDLSFHVVKLDKNGKDLGTAELRIQGRKLDYLFRDSRMEVEISPFDGMTIFLLDNDGTSGTITTSVINGYEVMTLTTAFYNDDEDISGFMDITFTEDMDCFVFYRSLDKVYYVGSASGNYDTRGILNYFNAISGSLAPER